MAAPHIELTVFADEVKYLAQLFRQLAIVADAFGELRQLLTPGDWLRHLVQPAQDQVSARLQIVTQAHRIAAGGDIFQALAVDRLKHKGGGCRAIATIFV